jgi:hypothetical protein
MNSRPDCRRTIKQKEKARHTRTTHTVFSWLCSLLEVFVTLGIRTIQALDASVPEPRY